MCFLWNYKSLTHTMNEWLVTVWSRQILASPVSLLAAQVLPQAFPQSVSGRHLPGAVPHLRPARPWDCLRQGRAGRHVQRSVVSSWPSEEAVLVFSCTSPIIPSLRNESSCFIAALQMTDSQNMEKWSLFSPLDQRKYMVRSTVFSFTSMEHCSVLLACLG